MPTPTDIINNQADFDAVNVEPPNGENDTLSQDEINYLLNPDNSDDDFNKRAKAFNQRQILKDERKRLLILVDAIDCKLDTLKD